MHTDNPRMIPLRTALGFGAGVAVFGIGTFVAGMYVAHADPGGHTRNALTVAGTLIGPTGPQSVTFDFANTQTGVRCSSAVTVTPGEGGAFSVDVPMDACRTTLFDGGDVTVEVRVGTLVVVPARPINPVPYARYADQVGTADCPVGYDRTSDAAFTGDMRLCQRRRRDDTVYDEVVRVGTGTSAFWIDRYESSIWENADGSGRQRLVSEGDLDQAVFPRNGQWVRPYYGLSFPGVEVARSVNWFMASAACRASGKRLPLDEEWLAAARRTFDPGMNNGVSPPNGRCHTFGPEGVAFRRAGRGADCQSAWGAQDMIGNVREWIGVWIGSPRTSVDDFSELDAVWQDRGSSYFGDGISDHTSWVWPGGTSRTRGPAAPLRGGSVAITTARATQAGVFYYSLYAGPSNWDVQNGFRCVIPR